MLTYINMKYYVLKIKWVLFCLFLFLLNILHFLFICTVMYFLFMLLSLFIKYTYLLTYWSKIILHLGKRVILLPFEISCCLYVDKS